MAFLQALNQHAATRGGLTPTCPFTYSNDFARFLEVNNMTYDTEAGATWLMLDAANVAIPGVIPRVAGDQAGLTCSLEPAQGAAPGAAVEYLTDATPEVRVLRQGVPKQAFRNLVADRHKALFWLLNLAACHQVKPLRANNIGNWFRMTSRVAVSGRTILRVLDFAATSIPNIMTNDDLRPLLDDNQFMEYHTAYSSTAKLVQEMLDSCPQVTNHMFSAETRAAVAASVADPTSRDLNNAISQQAILATVAYHRAVGKQIDAWYQGDKAVASLPANRLNLFTSIFTRVRALTSNLEDINNADSLANLIAAIGGNIQNV